ncbi:hypothetical protein J5I95_17745, partial [Candidatus Poribacteria bacterium]|nr:hypothetical protein [Candidatus Poribacteria bacterium]
MRESKAYQLETDPNAATPSRIVLDIASDTNTILGHENLGFLSSNRGFVPLNPTTQRLPPYFDVWENLVAELPNHYSSLRLRNLIEQLPILEADTKHLADSYLIRACSLLSILSHAYYYVRSELPENGLPPQLRDPWETVQRRLQRPLGVLSYIDLIVYNWQFKGPEESFDLNNLELLFPTVNNPSEQIFYLTQLEILAHCAPIVPNIVKAQEAIRQNNPEALKTALSAIIACLKKIVHKSLFNINPNSFSENYVDHITWAKTVAPFAVPFREDVLGPSGTSSPIFNLLDTFLERPKHETFLGSEIKALRATYPIFWQKFIAAVSEISLRAYVRRMDDPILDNLYQETIDIYVSNNGFLGRHRMKVYGYLELAFKMGRGITIGGFAGKFKDREHDQVDSELEVARLERIESFPESTHFAYIKSVSQTHTAGAPDVKHVVLDVEGTGIKYEPGDRCLILPGNTDALIHKTLQALRARDTEAEIVLSEEWQEAMIARLGFADVSLPLEVFLRYAQIRPVHPRIAHALYMVNKSKFLAEELRHQTTTNWELWEVLNQLSREGFDPRTLIDTKPTANGYLSRVVPPLNFKDFSISSAMDADETDGASELHLTVGMVEYQSNGEMKYGTTSKFLTDNLDSQRPISFRIEHPPRFSLPIDKRTPILMIAGGTGISPFRSFILERLKDSESGDMSLMFFTRSRAHFHYQEDLLHACVNERLKLFVKFSREDIEVDMEKTLETGHQFLYHEGTRGHIQECLADADISKEIWQFLQNENATPHVYICGRTEFAKAAYESLKNVFYQNLPGSSSEREVGATDYLAKLFSTGALKLEVYTNTSVTSPTEEDISVSELAQKNDPTGQCWMAIDNKVYDLTDFHHIHPGGQMILQAYYGLDATQSFVKVHKNRLDIDAFKDMYYIGRLHLPTFKENGAGIQKDTVELGKLYQHWVSALYLSVEMENTHLLDQETQNQSLIADESPSLKTPYKLEKAIETHKRFHEFYFTPLINEVIPELWELTQRMG